MTAAQRRARAGRARRPLAPGVLAWAARLALLGVVFFFGLALGRAIEEEDEPGGTQTLVRTLEPATLQPATATVTVTVTSQ